jgi:hypothetical protein
LWYFLVYQMSVFTNRFAGFLVLGVLLLLGVWADPAIMNSDESDDDTVVVAVEMDLVTPYKTIADAIHIQVRSNTALDEPGKRMAFAKKRSEHAPDAASAPLIVPLRT